MWRAIQGRPEFWEDRRDWKDWHSAGTQPDRTFCHWWSLPPRLQQRPFQLSCLSPSDCWSGTHLLSSGNNEKRKKKKDISLATLNYIHIIFCRLPGSLCQRQVRLHPPPSCHLWMPIHPSPPLSSPTTKLLMPISIPTLFFISFLLVYAKGAMFIESLIHCF